MPYIPITDLFFARVSIKRLSGFSGLGSELKILLTKIKAFDSITHTPDQSRDSPRKVRNFYMYIFKIRFVLNVSKVYLSMFSEKIDILRVERK